MNQSDAKSSDFPARTGHETSDVWPGAVGLFAAGLVLVLAFALPLLYWMHCRLESAAVRSGPADRPVGLRQTTPIVQLQVRPATDMQRLQAQDERLLSTYGWINRSSGAVRIPIDRAIELLSQRGIPEPTGETAPPRQERTR